MHEGFLCSHAADAWSTLLFCPNLNDASKWTVPGKRWHMRCCSPEGIALTGRPGQGRAAGPGTASCYSLDAQVLWRLKLTKNAFLLVSEVELPEMATWEQNEMQFCWYCFCLLVCFHTCTHWPNILSLGNYYFPVFLGSYSQMTADNNLLSPAWWICLCSL